MTRAPMTCTRLRAASVIDVSSSRRRRSSGAPSPPLANYETPPTGLGRRSRMTRRLYVSPVERTHPEITFQVAGQGLGVGSVGGSIPLGDTANRPWEDECARRAPSR